MTTPEPSAGARVSDVRSTDDGLVVDLMDGRTISVPLAWFPRLLHATPQQREQWELAGAGFGIHWPELDEDLSVAGLLAGAPAPSAFAPAR
jgi:Protein of unknown function (DUF2442)